MMVMRRERERMLIVGKRKRMRRVVGVVRGVGG